jgi:hypothetical protein
MANLFGFEIKRKKDGTEDVQSFAPPVDDEGSVVVTAGGAYGTYVDLEGTAKNEAELVTKYRNMVQQPEVQRAIEDIVNESIVVTDDEKVVECVTDDVEQPESIKKRIREEFDEVLRLLDFSNVGYDVFQKWYVDGRLYYHAIIDESKVRDGIKELRFIDPRKIRKVKEVEKKREGEAVVQKTKNEYYVYNEKGFNAKGAASIGSVGGMDSTKGLKIAKDSIVHTTSGILNENNSLVLSHLHKAIKPLNQLRMLEDASVIYRISRAPERRIFYIDVGNLPKMKAEQYLRDMMTKHKNRLVYDASTGEVRDDRKFMTMMEDFWLPRREGGRGTEITTLPGGQNLGEMEDIIYFQKKLYQALNVPVSRLEAENGFSLGRASEITRDEVKFSKFIGRLRNRFSILFDKILEKQLILKGVIAPEDWADIKAALRYDFMQDNHFEELKQAEILQNRLTILRDIDEYTGKYYSQKWVRENILQQSEDDIKEIDQEIVDEMEADEIMQRAQGGDEYGDEEEPMDEPVQQEPEPQANTQPQEQVISDEEKKLVESMTKFMDSMVPEED